MANVRTTALHQPGIATRQQAHLALAAFDLETDDLKELLVRWTQAAARLTGGRRSAGRLDSGEANELHAANLTITYGLGPSLFDRLGLQGRRPVALRPLPPFTGDALEPGRSDGDLCVQVCADDPQVVFHAVRTLTRTAAGAARVRWAQTGFVQRGTVRDRGPTPRGLVGFREGANNLRGDALLDRHVWIDRGDRSWMQGGTYLVMRRIRLDLPAWDALPVAEQERAIGREKVSGAEIRPKAPGAHVAVVREEPTRLLRRGYNYFDGAGADGVLDAGLVLICFARDPRRQFVPLQRRLAEADALAPYGLHTGSAVFAIPPAAPAGDFVAAGLLR